jgi:His-Xaa-Ser system protein HxsD
VSGSDGLTLQPTDGNVGGTGTSGCVVVDTNLYAEEALFRACQVFSGQCYVHVRQLSERQALVELTARGNDGSLSELLGAFANELVEQRVRADVERETRSIRELIVAQAFAEASFDSASPPTPAPDDTPAS